MRHTFIPVWLLVVTLLLPLGGCASFLSESQEIALGEQAQPQFIQESGGLVPSEALQQYVDQLGMQLAEVSERPQLPWEFHVVDSDIINAFALPGGKVFISRGLLAEMENEAQLAGVLGHEVGHVTGHHAAKRMSAAMGLQGLAVAALIFTRNEGDTARQLSMIGASLGGALVLNGYSRGQELEADERGVQYMTALGYNPLGQVQVMEILRQAAAGGSPPEFLSTHPHPDTRIERLEQMIVSEYPAYDDPAVYSFNQQRFQRVVADELRQLDNRPQNEKDRASLDGDRLMAQAHQAVGCDDPTHDHE
jgi:predicted Zn-dependent protease